MISLMKIGSEQGKGKKVMLF